MASSFRKGLGQFAAVAGPIIGGALGGPAGAAIGGAAGGALNGKGALKNAAIGGAAGYGGAKALQSFGVPLGGSSTSSSGGGGNFLGGIGKALSSFLGGGNAFAATAPSSTMSSPSAQGISSYFNPTGSAGFGGFGPMASVSSNGGGGVLNSFGGLIKKNPLATAGIGTSLLGLFAGKSPKAPGLPQSAQDYASQVRGGGSPLNQLATSKLTEGLNQPFQAVSADEEAAATRQLEFDQQREEDQVRDLYRNLRPGSDPSTDSSFQRDLGNVNDRYARLKADTVSQLHRQVYNDYQGQQAQRIGQAGGLDAQTQAAMQQVAQWDIDQIATQFGVDYNDAQQIKSFLMNEGQAIFNSQLPNQNPFAQFFKAQGAA